MHPVPDLDTRPEGRHAGDQEVTLERLRTAPGTLGPVEVRALRLAGITGADVVAMPCGDGADALSTLRLGAASCTGVDPSPELTESAGELAARSGARRRSRWVTADLDGVPEDLAGSADVLFTGKAGLARVGDVAAWAASACRVVRPGGRLVVVDAIPPAAQWVRDGGPPDVDAVEATAVPAVTDAVRSLLDAGLVLRRFEEVGAEDACACSGAGGRAGADAGGLTAFTLPDGGASLGPSGTYLVLAQRPA